MSEIKHLQIFISSPGDVAEERALCAKVIQRLQGEFSHRVKLDPIFWEHEPLRASATFQDEIPLPSETDIVVSILWTRLGTRLPEKYSAEEGQLPPTGTEFEVRDALQAFEANGNPDLLIYKKTAEPMASTKDRDKLQRILQQQDLLEKFTQEFFFNEDGSVKAAFHTFDQSSDFESTLEEHLRKLIDRKAPKETDIIAQDASWHEGSPFRGLQRFELKHSPIFFGRSKATSEVMSQLKSLASHQRHFLLIQGMSGSGKSSLACAGVLPMLIEPGVIEGIGLWRYAISKPSDQSDLFHSLAEALTKDHALPELLSDGTDVSDLVRCLQNPDSLLATIKGALRELAANCQREENLHEVPKARLVLILDQLEELFTHKKVSKEDRIKFFATISTLASSGLVWIIGTLRSDFYHRCEEIPTLMELKEGQGQYHLQAPSASEMGQMIRLPAQAAGVRFEKNADGISLDELILEQALDSPEALPLLEFCLEKLYKIGYKDRLLSFQEYEQIGRFEGALGHAADKAFDSLSSEAKDSFPQLMRRLITIEGDSIIRRWYTEDELNEIPGASPLIDSFKTARLLVSQGKDGQAYLSLTHEVLLRTWTKLVQLIERDREFLLLRARIEQSARQWASQQKDSSYLLPSGRALNEALGLYEDRPEDLDHIIEEFILKSKAKEEGQRKVKAALTLSIACILILLTTVSVIMGLKARKNERYALREKSRIEQQKLEIQKLHNKSKILIKNMQKNTIALKSYIGQGISPFHLSVIKGDLNEVQQQLKITPNLLTLPTKNDESPLSLASNSFCQKGLN